MKESKHRDTNKCDNSILTPVGILYPCSQHAAELDIQCSEQKGQGIFILDCILFPLDTVSILSSQEREWARTQRESGRRSVWGGIFSVVPSHASHEHLQHSLVCPVLPGTPRSSTTRGMAAMARARWRPTSGRRRRRWCRPPGGARTWSTRKGQPCAWLCGQAPLHSLTSRPQ